MGPVSLCVFIATAALNLANASTVKSSADSKTGLFNKLQLRNKVLQASPKDIENNTTPYLRYGLDLFSPNNYPATLYSKFGNTGSNVLNYNYLNTGTDASNPLVSLEKAIGLQAVNQLLQPSPTSNAGNVILTPLLQNYLISKQYQPSENNYASLLSALQLLQKNQANPYYLSQTYGSIVPNNNNLLLNSLQPLLRPQNQLGNVQYETLHANSNDELIRALQGLLKPQNAEQGLSQSPSDNNNVETNNQPDSGLDDASNVLYNHGEEGPVADLQELDESPPTLRSVYQPPPNDPPTFQPPFSTTYQPTLQQSLSPTLQPNGQTNTQLLFNPGVPNLDLQECKLAFETLIHKAYNDYMSLVNFPACQNYGQNFNPTKLPFEVIVVQPNIVKPSMNPLLLKLVWLLLNKLQQQAVPNNLNQNALLDLLLKQQNPLYPDLPKPQPQPNQLLQNLLNLLTNRNNPNNYSKQYVIDVITNILNNHNQRSDLFDKLQTWKLPIELQLGLNKEPTHNDPTFLPTTYPNDSNGKVKYVILVFKKYFPQHQFTTPDIEFLVKLLKLLPKSMNELLSNPQLLNFVINQLSGRNLNPKLVLSVIYNHLINLPLPNGQQDTQAVELVFQVQKQSPIVYKPYYYVTYKLPLSVFKKNLYSLLLAKPDLKNNRDLMFKELLLLALNNDNGLDAGLNGVTKDQLVNLLLTNGAVSNVKVLTENNGVKEQLNVFHDINKLDTFRPASGVNLNLENPTSTNLWEYLIKKNSGAYHDNPLQELTNPNLVLPKTSDADSLLQLLENSNNPLPTDLSQLLSNSGNNELPSDLSQLLANTGNNQLPLDLSQLLSNSGNNQLPADLLQLLGNTGNNQVPSDLSQLLSNSDNNQLPLDISQLLSNSGNNQLPADLLQLLGNTGNNQLQSDLSQLLSNSGNNQLPAGLLQLLSNSGNNQLSADLVQLLGNTGNNQLPGDLVQLDGNSLLQALENSGYNLKSPDQKTLVFQHQGQSDNSPGYLNSVLQALSNSTDNSNSHSQTLESLNNGKGNSILQFIENLKQANFPPNNVVTENGSSFPQKSFAPQNKPVPTYATNNMVNNIDNSGKREPYDNLNNNQAPHKNLLHVDGHSVQFGRPSVYGYAKPMFNLPGIPNHKLNQNHNYNLNYDHNHNNDNHESDDAASYDDHSDHDTNDNDSVYHLLGDTPGIFEGSFGNHEVLSTSPEHATMSTHLL